MSIVSKFVKKVKAAISLLFEQLEKENEKEIEWVELVARGVVLLVYGILFLMSSIIKALESSRKLSKYNSNRLEQLEVELADLLQRFSQLQEQSQTCLVTATSQGSLNEDCMLLLSLINRNQFYVDQLHDWTEPFIYNLHYEQKLVNRYLSLLDARYRTLCSFQKQFDQNLKYWGSEVIQFNNRLERIENTLAIHEDSIQTLVRTQARETKQFLRPRRHKIDLKQKNRNLPKGAFETRNQPTIPWLNKVEPNLSRNVFPGH